MKDYMRTLTPAQRKYWTQRLKWIDANLYGDHRYPGQRQFEESIVFAGGTNEIEQVDGFNRRADLRKNGCQPLGEAVYKYFNLDEYKRLRTIYVPALIAYKQAWM